MGCAPREHGALRRQRLEVLGDRKLVGVNGLTTQEIVGGRHDLQGRQSEIMGRRDTHGRAPKGESLKTEQLAPPDAGCSP